MCFSIKELLTTNRPVMTLVRSGAVRTAVWVAWRQEVSLLPGGLQSPQEPTQVWFDGCLQKSYLLAPLETEPLCGIYYIKKHATARPNLQTMVWWIKGKDKITSLKVRRLLVALCWSKMEIARVILTSAIFFHPLTISPIFGKIYSKVLKPVIISRWISHHM